MIPSFNDDWAEGQRIKPRILVLEVRHPKFLDLPPVACLIVERNETIHRGEYDNSIYQASVTLSYEVIQNNRLHTNVERGCFSGSYSKSSGLVSLTSSSLVHGAVFLDPERLKGHRIGTYLMNEIVTWVKRWPEAEVNSVKLLASQAQDDNKERRNRFYEQFGLEFDYTDTEHSAGTSRPILTRDLTLVENWKENITEHRMSDFLADTLTAKESAIFDLRIAKQSIKELLAARLSAQQHPIRWALRHVYFRWENLIIGGALLALLASAVLFRA